MLVRTQNQLLHTNLENLKNFSVKISPKFFDIMSAQLYSNPKKAVIRELANNAYDAVKALGKPVSSIRISAPTFINPFFIVEDCGPGLSPEEMDLYYTCYFSSSKDQSDDYIGGFGLGCKSPFALTDNFTVISCHGGMRRTYFLFRKEGVPAISLVSEEPCGNQTGLTVKVPISPNDFTEFNNILRDFFAWWPELPSFNNIDVMSHVQKEHILSLDNFQIYAVNASKLFSPTWPDNSGQFSKNYYTFRTHIFVGNTLYRVDTNHSKYSSLADAIQSIYNTIIIYANVGDVELTPSREQLYYSPITVDFIHSSLSKILDNLGRHFQALLHGNINFHDFVKACVSPVATIKNPQHLRETFKFFNDIAFHLQYRGTILHFTRASNILTNDEAYTLPSFIQTYNKNKGLYEKGLTFLQPTVRTDQHFSYHKNNNKVLHVELAPQKTIFFSSTEHVLNKQLFTCSRQMWENCHFTKSKDIEILIIDLAQVTEKDIRTLRRYIEHQDNENLTLIITDDPQKYMGHHSAIRMATNADIQRMLESAPPVIRKVTPKSQKLTLIELLRRHAFTYDPTSGSLIPYRLPHATNFWVPFSFQIQRDYHHFDVPAPLSSWLVKNSPDIQDIAFVPVRFMNRTCLKQMVLYNPKIIAQNPFYLQKLFNTFITVNTDEKLFPITGAKLYAVLQTLKFIKKTSSSATTHPDFTFMWETLNNVVHTGTKPDNALIAYDLFHNTSTWTDLSKKASDIFGRFIFFLQTNPSFTFMVLGAQNPIIDTPIFLDIVKDKADTFFTPSERT